MYQVSRNGQFYGPYSLEELQRYLSTGNVLSTDLAKSADMAEWLPVAQILHQTGRATAQQPAMQPQVAPYAASPYPDPPNLHWALYLVLTIVTFTLFSKVFTVVQAAWLKRVQPNSNALYFYIGYYVLYVPMLFLGLGRGLTTLLHPGIGTYGSHSYGGLTLLRIVLLIVTRFIMSASLEEHFNGPEPIGLRLNPVATFFFGGVYFQSQFNRINELRQMARYAQPRTL